MKQKRNSPSPHYSQTRSPYNFLTRPLFTRNTLLQATFHGPTLSTRPFLERWSEQSIETRVPAES